MRESGDSLGGGHSPGGRLSGGAAAPVEHTGVVQLANVLLKRWKLIVGLPVAAAFVTALVSLLVPSQFTATATFVPEGESSGMSLPGGLASIAAQFGVGIPIGGSDSPRFYADVLKSRTIRDQVLLAAFPDPRSEAAGDSATLLDLLEIEGDSESERLEAGRKALAKTTGVRVDNETNIVTIAVETRYPVLSAGVANLILELLNRFNLETRQSNAQERRSFVEERVGEAEAELREAEEELKVFYERNRQYEGSPELRFQADRLQRQVTLKEEVLSTLRRQYEEARIQEVNDTPVITVIDRALPPEEKSSPKRRSSVLLAFFLGAVLAVSGAFGREYLDRARVEDEEEFEEFSARWTGIKREIRGMFRRSRSVD
jgi:uncharacterized protein involved in exopolysaccharide biosynthesis